jgi:hypothetical protein
MRRALLGTLLALVLSAGSTPAMSSPQRFVGEWAWHFETSAFTSSDGEGPYWLSADRAVWEQLSAPFATNGSGPWGRAQIVVEGTLSAPGQYGHLGAYQRELRVTRVIDVRLISARESSVPSSSLD